MTPLRVPEGGASEELESGPVGRGCQGENGEKCYKEGKARESPAVGEKDGRRKKTKIDEYFSSADSSRR